MKGQLEAQQWNDFVVFHVLFVVKWSFNMGRNLKHIFFE